MGAISVPNGADAGDTARLESATTTSLETIAFSRVLLVSFGLILLAFILLELPWTAFRMSHFGATTGWALSSSPPKRSPHAPKHHGLPDKTSDSSSSHRLISGSSLPRRIGRLPLALPTYTVPHLNLSLAQSLLILLAFVMVLIAGFTNSNWLTDSTRTGYVAITLVPCVISLGNKVFGVGTFLSVGYAAVNWAHRWLGRILFLITTIHVIAYITIFVQTHSFRSEMSKPANALATISYLGFCLIFFASLGVVRKNWWHIFKACHHFGIFMFVIGLNYHSTILRPWVIFCVLFVGLSVISRTLTTRLHIAYLTPLPNSKSTIVHLPSVRSGWLPGQSVRIRVLTGGMGVMKIWEAHPFTIAAAPDAGDGAKLIVKAAGDWTNRLFALAKKAERRSSSSSSSAKDSDTEEGDGDLALEKSGSRSRNERRYPVAVLIEGPYGGCNLVYSAFSSVLLAAGGSGVSYILAVAQGIVADSRRGRAATRDLHIVWTVRDRSAIDEMLPLFESLAESAAEASGLRLVVELYFTSVSRGLVALPGLAIVPKAIAVAAKVDVPVPPSARTSTFQISLASAAASEDDLNEMDEEKKNPFSDLHAPPPPSPTTKPTFTPRHNRPKSYHGSPLAVNGGEMTATPSPTSSSPLSHSLTAAQHDAPPPSIELKPGRPPYLTILQSIIHTEQSRARSFVEVFRSLNPSSSSSYGSMGPEGILRREGAVAGRVAVGACGPSGMVGSLREMCHDAQGVEFCAEEFSL